MLTVTLKQQRLLLPKPSTAQQQTGDVPDGKTLPGGGLQPLETMFVQALVAVKLK